LLMATSAFQLVRRR